MPFPFCYTMKERPRQWLAQLSGSLSPWLLSRSQGSWDALEEIALPWVTPASSAPADRVDRGIVLKMKLGVSHRTPESSIPMSS